MCTHEKVLKVKISKCGSFNSSLQTQFKEKKNPHLLERSSAHLHVDSVDKLCFTHCNANLQTTMLKEQNPVAPQGYIGVYNTPGVEAKCALPNMH